MYIYKFSGLIVKSRLVYDMNARLILMMFFLLFISSYSFGEVVTSPTCDLSLPDVCTTPVPPATPIPYPNIGTPKPGVPELDAASGLIAFVLLVGIVSLVFERNKGGTYP